MRVRTPPVLVTKRDAVHRAFKHWRRTRRHRSPIPAPLWAMAVERARAAGIHATARRLRLNASALKHRVAASSPLGATPVRAAPAFVELVAGGRRVPGGADCVIELADARGTTMRISLTRPALPDLAALGRAVWSARA